MRTQRAGGSWTALLLTLVMAGCGQRELGSDTMGGVKPVPTPGTVVSGAGGAAGWSGGTGGWSGAGGWMGGGGGGAGPSTPSCPSISTVPGQLNPCGRTNGIAYSPDGQLLAMATESPRPNVHLWRLGDGVHVRDLDGVGNTTYAVAFSPDAQTLAVAGEGDSGAQLVQVQPDIVKLYDVASGTLIRTIPATCGFYADSVAFSSDGTLLATSGAGARVEVWRVADGSLVTGIPYQASAHNVHFSPDGSRVIVGGVDGFASVWSIPDGKLVMYLSGIAPEMADAAFSPDGRQIASTGDDNNNIKVWDAASGDLLQELAGHAAYVSHVLWISQDRFVTNDWSGAVLSWSRGASGAFAASGGWSTGGQSLGIAVSPDRTRLVTGGGDQNQGFLFLSL